MIPRAALAGFAVIAMGLLLVARRTPTEYVALPATPDPAARADIAWKTVTARGFDLTGFSVHQYLAEEESPLLHAQHELGDARVGALARTGELPLIYWFVRLFKPGEERRHAVRLSLDGQVLGFEDVIPESVAGDFLDEDAALARMKGALGGSEGWKEVEFHRIDREKRRDYQVVYSRRLAADPDLEIRRLITLRGGSSGGVKTYLHLSETAENRERSQDRVADALFYLSVLADAILLLAALGVLLGSGRTPTRAELRVALVPASAVFLVLAASAVNYMPVYTARNYVPVEPYWAFWTSGVIYLTVLGLLPALAALVTLLAAGRLEGDGPSRARTFHLLLEGNFRHPDVGRSMARGLLFSLVLGGGEAIFYAIGQGSGQVVLPVSALWVNTMASPLPLLFPLSISIGASITEEAAFRWFAVGGLQQVPRLRAFALVLPAAAWAFAHSREPVYPVGTRGIELFLGGLVMGWFFLRTDLLTMITAHYLYDAVTFGWPLLRSPDPSCQVGALVVVGLVAVPGLLGMRALLSPPRDEDHGSRSNVTRVEAPPAAISTTNGSST